MAPSGRYDIDFFSQYEAASTASARKIVPLVLDLIKPRSVVDVGCGLGTWLAACTECGIEDILGIDGNYVDRASLKIPIERFMPHDLTKKLIVPRRFDMAMCMEVAEHLPAAVARDFVDSLTELAPVVLFSAAIPHQGGTHHVNEQWPEYWVNLFSSRGYVIVDAIRRRVWSLSSVDMVYAQNTLLLVSNSRLEQFPELLVERERTSETQLSIVHPRLYEARVSGTDPQNYGPGGLVRLQLRLLRYLPTAISRALRRRLGQRRHEA
jgi:SAM-dependent methyltransferase